MNLLRSKFLSRVGSKLELPTAEIFVHLLVTVLSVLSIAFVEWMLSVVGLDGKEIPGTHITLGHWMFGLEVVAATAIISVGVMKAVVALWKSK